MDAWKKCLLWPVRSLEVVKMMLSTVTEETVGQDAVIHSFKSKFVE